MESILDVFRGQIGIGDYYVQHSPVDLTQLPSEGWKMQFKRKKKNVFDPVVALLQWHLHILSIEDAGNKENHHRTDYRGIYDVIALESEVTQSCPTPCEPMNCSTQGLPVHHQLPEFTQTHVH